MQGVVVVLAGHHTFRASVATSLARAGCVVTEADPGAVLPTAHGASACAVVLAPGDAEVLPWLGRVRDIRGGDRVIPIVLVVRQSSEELVIAALRAGVSDYLRFPVSSEELADGLRRWSAATTRRGAAEAPTATALAGHRLIGESARMREVRDYVAKVARTDSNVLITGETGTGKELVAELLHRTSDRQHAPFVSINCAAIPDDLLESELFGHERGAFTGAHALREGKLRLAGGGSVFFDEVGDMSPYAQAKVLRAIENKEVQRLGGGRPLPVNVRIIAATNQDLERMVEEHRFRCDLFFRLNVARVHLPPLRERKEDIALLCGHYIREFNGQFDRRVEGLTDEAMTRLLRYDWPGNVREIRNIMEAIFVQLPPHHAPRIDIPPEVSRRLGEVEQAAGQERDRLLSALFATNWNKSQAARRLHWSRMTLYRKLVKYQQRCHTGRPDVTVSDRAG